MEYAPIGMLEESDIDRKIEDKKEEKDEIEELSKVVYVKNLNFQNDEQALEQFISQVVDP